MRFLYTFTLTFFTVFVANAQSVDRVVEGTQFPGALAVRNFVLNPGCEKNVNNITASGGSLTRTTTTPVEGAGSCLIDASSSAQTYTWTLQAFEQAYKNGNCYARFTYTGDATLYDAEILRNSVTIASQTLLDASSNSKVAEMLFSCGDLTNATTFRLRATSASAAAVKVDSVYVGFAPPMALQTTKGDLVGIGTSGVPSRLAIGSDGTALLADSSATHGFSWQSVGGSQSYELSNVGLSVGVGSSAATIALKQSDGSTNCSTGASACKIGFRSATATNGGYNQRTVTSSLSTVISAGSTAGFTSATDSYLYIYALDNSGTVELAWSGTLFDEGSVQSTTAEGGAGAADSGRVLYSTTARSNVPIRLLERVKIQNSSGNWTSAATEVSPIPFRPQTIFASAKSTSGQTITAGSTDIIDFATKISDVYNLITTGASWKATIPLARVCHVNAAVLIGNNPIAVDTAMTLALYKNGSVIRYLDQHRYFSGTSVSHHLIGSAKVAVAAGDYLDVRVINGDDSSQSLSASDLLSYVDIWCPVGEI